MNGTEPLCDNNVEGQPSATVQRGCNVLDY